MKPFQLIIITGIPTIQSEGSKRLQLRQAYFGRTTITVGILWNDLRLHFLTGQLTLFSLSNPIFWNRLKVTFAFVSHLQFLFIIVLLLIFKVSFFTHRT